MKEEDYVPLNREIPKSDTHLVPPEHSRRNYTLVVLSVLVATLLVLGSVIAIVKAETSSSDRSSSTRHALCALRADVQSRVDQGDALLASHPNGFAGISPATLTSSIGNSKRTVQALSSLSCPQ